MVREIEVYNAFRIHEVTKSVRVYFLMYEDSTEEQRYLNTVKSEMKAFKQLIQEMSHIVIPNSELYPLSTSQALKEKELTISQTRIGGRGKKKIHVPSVIVDLREFRSALPAILHNEGIQLQPVTLEVGDYVLSRDVCVERKSIPDLIGSLQSGRLYVCRIFMFERSFWGQHTHTLSPCSRSFSDTTNSGTHKPSLWLDITI